MAESRPYELTESYLTSTYAIQTILKSTSILDEDLTIILEHFCPEDYSTGIKLPLHQTLLSGLSAAGTLLLLQNKSSMAYIPFLMTPLLYVGVNRLRDALYRRSQRRDVEGLVKFISETFKLLRSIVCYFQLKTKLKFGDTSSLDQITQPNWKLIQVILYEVTQFLNGLIDFVGYFISLVPSLNDYSYLKTLDLKQFDVSNISSMADCAVFVQSICDVYLLICSNALTCLAVTLCSKSINSDDVFDIISKMKKISKTCHDQIGKEFDNVKFYQFHKTMIEEIRQPKIFRRGKPTADKTNLVVYTSEIVDKSHFALQQLEKYTFEDPNGRKSLVPVIRDLRKHAQEYFEFLDIFCKIYEIDVNQPKPPGVLNKSSSTEPSENSSVVTDSLFFDASPTTEPLGDEEYELTIDANDPTPQEAAACTSYYEGPDRQYVAALNQELRTVLRDNAAFAAARDKRGIIEEEIKKAHTLIPPHPPRSIIPQPPPGCDAHASNALLRAPPPPPPPLPPLNLEQLDDAGFIIPLLPPPGSDFYTASALIRAPPPPPLPSLNLGQLYDTDPLPNSTQKVENFLESIRAVSSVRQENEEVFQLSEDEKR